MKIRLKYFLLACLLLGALGVRWGWKAYKSRVERLAREKAAEIEQFDAKQQIEELLNELAWERLAWERGKNNKARIAAIEARLEKLTGKRPTPPAVARRKWGEVTGPGSIAPTDVHPIGIASDGKQTQIIDRSTK